MTHKEGGMKGGRTPKGNDGGKLPDMYQTQLAETTQYTIPKNTRRNEGFNEPGGGRANRLHLKKRKVEKKTGCSQCDTREMRYHKMGMKKEGKNHKVGRNKWGERMEKVQKTLPMHCRNKGGKKGSLTNLTLGEGGEREKLQR